MKITFNPDTEIVKTVQDGLKHTGGYCPCLIERSEDTKCICKDFREKIKDPEFEGFIRNFASQSLPKIYSLLETYKDEKQVIIFKSHKEADDFLEKLQ